MKRDLVSGVNLESIGWYRLAVHDVNFEGVSFRGLGPFRVGVAGEDIKPLFGPVYRELMRRNVVMITAMTNDPPLREQLVEFVKYWDA